MSDRKRVYITTQKILSVYGRYPADGVVWSAMCREEDRGYLDYGVNLRGGRLTDKGKQTLAELKGENDE